MNYSFRDKTSIQGYVEIYSVDKLQNKQLVSKSNLVVYLGREWLLSRIVNYDNTNIQPVTSDYLCWLSVGTGGAPTTDPLSPIPPTNTDTSLANEVPINLGNVSFADNGYKTGFSDITFLQDNLNLNEYLIMRIDVLLNETMATGYNINEAGLWVSNSNNPSLANQWFLFSRVTFPTFAKGPDNSLQIIWYIYS